MIIIHDINNVPDVLCPGIHYAVSTTVSYVKIHDEIKELIIKSFVLNGVPAGFVRGRLPLSVDPIDSKKTASLYERGINPIQYISKIGSVLYGAKYIDHDLKIKRMGGDGLVFNMKPFQTFISPIL